MLTSCSTLKSRLCILPGQHSRTNPVDQGTGDLSLQRCMGDVAPIPHLPYCGVGEGEKIFLYTNPSPQVVDWKAGPETGD